MNQTNQIPPYLLEAPNIERLITKKHLILDTNVFIHLITFKATTLLDFLEKQNAVLCTIHPVMLELLNTNNDAERLIRQSLLDRVLLLPLEEKVIKKAYDIQLALSFYQTYPEPTDLYLASVLARYNKYNFN